MADKIWCIFTSKHKNCKKIYYFNEDDFLKAGGYSDDRIVKVYAYESEDIVKHERENVLKSRERDRQLSVVLNDDADGLNYTVTKINDIILQKIEEIKSTYSGDSPTTRRQHEYLVRLGRELRATTVDKDSLSKFCTRNKNILLYQVDTTVDWYKLVLKMRSFRGLDEKYKRNHSWLDNSVNIVENFLQAKEDLKLERNQSK